MVSLLGTARAATEAAADRLVVATGSAPVREQPVGRRRLVLRVFLLALAVGLVVMVAGGLVARQLAESEAVRDATTRTDDIAFDVVQPALRDGLVTGDASALQRLDERVRAMSGRDVARVKVWSADGTILYSDAPALIGEHYGLDHEEAEALVTGRIEAEITDLAERENRYERTFGTLLEVYRPVHTPDGTPLLFEVYYRYDDVVSSSEHIWIGFAGVIGASVLLFLLAMLPLLDRLVRSVERAREERELSLLKALDSSDAERRRIAAAVHDGPVQDLVGASYRLGAAAADVADTEVGPIVAGAERAVRESVDGLRDMLIDLYPASMSESGLATALHDLVAGARARGAIVLLRHDDDLRMSADSQRVLFRVARETIANAVKHGAGTPVVVEVRRVGTRTLLQVHDDRPGFDAGAALHDPPAGHFGMRLLQDAVRESGVDAVLTVESAPGQGTTWRLSVV